MKRLMIAAITLSMATLAAAEQPARSDVEARLDALEKINVTAYKPQRSDADAKDTKDAEIDSILSKAAQAEEDAKDTH